MITEIKTDASTTDGCGALCNSSQTGLRWNSEEEQKHTNVLEMPAVEYVLKTFQNRSVGYAISYERNTCVCMGREGRRESQSAGGNEMAINRI